jgi:hypothetical protein
LSDTPTLFEWQTIVLALGYLALDVVEHLAFDEDHWIVIAYGALEQALGICWSGWHHHFQSRDVGVPALECLGVLGGELERGTTWPAKHRGHAYLPVGHVAHLRG